MKYRNFRQRLKQSIALLLVMASFFGAIQFQVFATDDGSVDDTQSSTEQSTPVLIVEDVVGKAGDKVPVNVIIENNPGILNAVITLSYNSELTLTEASPGEAFKELTMTKPGAFVSPCNFAWDGLDATDKTDGVILSLVFKIPEDAKVADKYSVEVSYVSGDIKDGDENSVEFKIGNGYIGVDYMPGDVNEDGRINATDINLIRRYIAGGYNVEIAEIAADVNDDGRINANDVTTIRRYIAGGYNTVLKEHTACKNFLVHHNKVAPTCHVDGGEGIKEYWSCSLCGDLYLDANAAVTVSEYELVIEGLAHTPKTIPGKSPEYGVPGYTDAIVCDVCGYVIQESVELPALEYNELNIKYYNTRENYDMSTIPEEYWKYKQGELFELPVLEAEGYNFLGYSKTRYYGDKTELFLEINGEEKDNLPLYAQWELKEYSITYTDVLGGEIPEEVEKTYTIEDSFVIYTPKWKGLTFSHWEDTSGKLTVLEDAVYMKHLKLEKGTTGEIELVAKWRSNENLIVPKKTNQLNSMGFNEDRQMYYFVYELGKIQNVVLDPSSVLLNPKYHQGHAIELDFAESLTISKDVAKTIADAVSHSTSSSEGWSIMNGWAEEMSYELGVSVKTGVEAGIGVEGVASAKASVETEINEKLGLSASMTTENTKNGLVEIGKEESHEVSSTISYGKEYTVERSEKLSLGESDPVGYYSAVHAGTINVYAIAIYHPETKTFYLETYSVLTQVYDMVLYERDGYTDYADETLNFYVDAGELESVIDTLYYVEYDANGGTGSIDKEYFAKDVSLALDNGNGFSKTGYKLSGWKLLDDSGNQLAFYTPGQEVTNLAAPGETVTLVADWRAVTYNITYVQSGTYMRNGEKVKKEGHRFINLPEILRPSNYVEPSYPTTYTVEKRFTVSGLNFPDYPEYNHFTGWYFDEACTKPFNYEELKTDPRDVTLYAGWDLCNVYTSVFETPWGNSGRTILDWSNEQADSNGYVNMLNIERKNIRKDNSTGEERRYTLDINRGAKDIIFIGDPQKTYINFYISFCAIAEGENINIRFDNFKFITNAWIATNLWECGAFNLNFDVIGDCYIGTSYSGGYIIFAPKCNVTFTGSGTLTIEAGNGADATTAGESGGSGGIGIYATILNVDMCKGFLNKGTLNVYGGDGGDGAKGVKGANGQNAVLFGREATGGEKGGVGGNAGGGLWAVIATDINLYAGVINLFGGDGGDAGDGGDGGDGGKPLVDKKELGGAGGDPGRQAGGCIAVFGKVHILSSHLVEYSEVNGSAGAAGNQGNAGKDTYK